MEESKAKKSQESSFTKQNRLLSRSEVKDSVLLILKRYNMLGISEIKRKVGTRISLISSILNELVKENRVRELDLGNDRKVYKYLKTKVEACKHDIRKALNFYYGKRCENLRCNCFKCVVHKWLDNAEVTNDR